MPNIYQDRQAIQGTAPGVMFIAFVPLEALLNIPPSRSSLGLLCFFQENFQNLDLLNSL
jgi:hypothetical protein